MNDEEMMVVKYARTYQSEMYYQILMALGLLSSCILVTQLMFIDGVVFRMLYVFFLVISVEIFIIGIYYIEKVRKKKHLQAAWIKIRQPIKTIEW